MKLFVSFSYYWEHKGDGEVKESMGNACLKDMSINKFDDIKAVSEYIEDDIFGDKKMELERYGVAIIYWKNFDE